MIRQTTFGKFLFILGAALCTTPLLTADWPQFRGSGSSGASTESRLPISLGKESLVWKAGLPGRGVSSPIIISGRVVVTASSGFRQDRLHVLCFDLAGGEKLWERQFWATGRTMCHPKTCMAAPTPASDGERIFALYSTNDLVCLDLEGNLIWLRGLTLDYPNASNSVGMASSLLVAGGVVVAQVENDCHSFAAGLDLKTGENRWKIERPRKPNWSSPVILQGRTREEDVLILQSWLKTSGHDPATGRELWTYSENCTPIPSSVPQDGVLYLPSKGLTALQPEPGNGNPKILWQSQRLGPGTASPLVYLGKLYSVSGAGVLSCADRNSGEIIWRLRLQGPISSSPVAAAGHIYIINEKGLVQVVKLGEKGEIAGTADLGETILSTPAISGGALFIRSDRHLYRYSKPAGGS